MEKPPIPATKYSSIDSVVLCADPKLRSQLTYPLGKLEAALAIQGMQLAYRDDPTEPFDLSLQLTTLEQDNEPDDGYALSMVDDVYALSAEHRRGLIYGLLYLVELLASGQPWGTFEEVEISAQYPFRAIKFNLPWYSYRSGEHLSLHTETARDLTFWQSFLDMMVENKFNTLTLWNMHPFMYMVKSKTFPRACPFSDEELAEWRSFWKALFKMASERGIDSYVINWNIFVSQAFAEEYGSANYANSSDFLGDGETNPLIEQYTREMVTQTIDEYEDLTGIGLTLGERMGGMTSEERRDWVDRTIIPGIKAAKRKARLIYRAPLSANTASQGSANVSTEQITRHSIETLGMDDTVWIEFKFNWSHAHSSPKLSLVHGGMLTDTYWEPLSDKYKGVWTMRNEDFFVMRWAQPDFIREFITLNSQPYIGGALIGSETYIPAKDYITKEEHRSWQYAFERQWLFYKVWGNLLYNSQTTDDYFAGVLARKFSLQDGGELLSAWKLASKNANRFASFFKGTWDATIYTEGFTTLDGQFIDINRFIAHPVLDESYANIEDFVRGLYDTDKQITPLNLADLTQQESQQALNIVSTLREMTVSKDLAIELTDIEFWANYGFYFANKIQAGVALERFRQHHDKSEQEKAVRYLETALEQWRIMVTLAETYNVQIIPYQFDPAFSWRKHIVDAETDIEIARQNIVSDEKINLR